MKTREEKRALTLILLFTAAAALFYAWCGGRAHPAVQDNLDLFQAQYAMLRNTGTFFSRGVPSPFLGGISRDVLPSERQLPGLVYLLLPPLAAYHTLYLIRILVSVISFLLLGEEIALRSGAALSGRQRAAVMLCGFACGIVNVFPAFGVCFTSIPLAVWLMLRLVRTEGMRQALPWLAGLFCYPFLSYFSYFGLFILAYAALVFAVLAVRAAVRRIRGRSAAGQGGTLLRLFLGIAALSAGYIFFEYRIFAQMLFSDEVTIRSSIVMQSLTLAGAMRQAADVFLNNMFHADALQKYLVMPVCAVHLAIIIVRCARTRRILRRDRLFIAGLFLIVFNCAVYGLYYFAPVRGLVETLLPPLRGWQFNRTVFFDPFLWYGLLAAVCVQLAEQRKGLRRHLAQVLPLLAAAVVLVMPTNYNDLRASARAEAYRLIRGQEINDLSYESFYSPALFSRIKEDIGYREGDFASVRLTGEAAEGRGDILAATGADWSVAYGLYPAVLEYNGVATLDGYLGFYEQQYKERFRDVIAPALEARPATKSYFDDWGARCYLYSGEEDSIVQPVRRYAPATKRLSADADALRDMGCRYIFSRIGLENAEELGLTLRGVYTDEVSPYTIWVYGL